MARIVKFFKTVRNNWKKSVVFAGAFSYGVSYGVESYDTEQLMREYSIEAAKYGDQPQPTGTPLRHVTVILNPIAKKRKCKKLFEKHCEPLLHLAGIAVTVIQTEQEGQARGLIEKLETPTDAIVVAGGDGTLSDVVTGLMRKYNTNARNVRKCPIGILPLGQRNRMADSLFHSYEDLEDVRQLAEASMAIVRGDTRTFDVVEVQPLDDDPENNARPAYAVGAIEWGAWRDAGSRVNKYWYWGPLRKYMTYVFTGYKKDVNWDCNATIKYSEPCHGCSRCYQEHHSPEEVSTGNRRWWQAFVSRRAIQNTGPDYSKVHNEKCGDLVEVPVSTTEMHLSTGNVRASEPGKPPSIKVDLGPTKVSYTDFIAEGWRRAKGEKTSIAETLEAKHIELYPNKSQNFEDKEQLFSIDNEEFELKPLRIRLLPQSITMFYPRLDNQ